MDLGRHFPTFSRFASWLRQMPGARASKWVFAVVAILLATRLVLDAWATRRLQATIVRLEKEWGKLDPATLAPPAVPDVENGTRFLRAAGELIVKEGPSEGARRSWTDPLLATGEERTLLAMLAPNELPLKIAAEARRFPRSNWGISYEKGFQANIPPLLALINLSKLLAASAMISILHDDDAGAAEALESGFTISDSLRREPVFIVQLIAIAVDRLNAAAIRELLARGEPSAEELRGLQGRVERASTFTPISDGLVGEMKLAHKTISRYVASGYSLDPEAPARLGSRVLARLLHPLTNEDHRFYLESMDAQLRWSAKPAWKRRGESLSEVMTRGAPWYLFVSRQLLPNLENAIRRGDMNAARLVLAGAALALRRYRLDHGEYPESLNALVPVYLDSVPKDPFTGEPPEYRREGSGFVLRSAGEDIKELDWDPKREKVLAWRIPR